MRKKLLDMRKLAIGAALAGIILAVPPNASAQRPQGPSQSDHALMVASEHIHCGVAMGNSGRKAESYTLHITASTVGLGVLTIKFADSDTISFNIPAGGSVSTTQELGGVPEVDDVVQITLTGSGAAMASVKVRAGSRDPFDGDDELDNFCLTHPDDPGAVPDGYPL